MKERLKQLIDTRGIKSAQLAQAVGLSTSTMDDILKGKTNELNIGVDKMLKIASVLRVSVEFLYGRDEPIRQYSPSDPAERRLLEQFRELNEEGQEKALGYLNDLVDTGKYKKIDSLELVQEA